VKLLSYYIGRVILVSMLFASLVIAGLDFFIQCLHAFRHINAHYTVKAAWLSVLLRLPGDVYHLSPPLILIGTLLGLGIMTHTRELIAMRIAGASLKVITLPICVTVILSTVGITGLGETLAPALNTLAARYKMTAHNPGKTLPTNAGTWTKSQQDFIRIGRIGPNGRLEDISRYHVSPSGQLLFVAAAKNGEFKAGQWFFYDVTYSNLLKNKTSSYHHARETWPVQLDRKQLALAKVDPDQQTLYQLYQQIVDAKQLKQANKQGYDYLSAYQFWWRLSQPIISLLMAGMAVPFVLHQSWQSTRKHHASSIAIGLIPGLSFYGINLIIAPLSQTYPSTPWLITLGPSLLLLSLFGVVGLVKYFCSGR